MFDYLRKFLKFCKSWEYYDSRSFQACIGSVYFCFTTLFSYASSSSNNHFKLKSQARVVIEGVRFGVQEQDKVVNSVDNLDKKKYFKEMMVNYFPDFEPRISL